MAQCDLLADGAHKLRIIGYQTSRHENYVEEWMDRANALGLADRVEFVGSVPTRRELLEWGRRCDIGLALVPTSSQDLNEQTMWGASNKPFDYLACGLALLVSDLPGWREMYVESECGLACRPEDTASIVGALRWFLEHPNAMREMGERGRQRIRDEWNYERQFSPISNFLAETGVEGGSATAPIGENRAEDHHESTG